ncbi:MAG: hypothetical protein ACK5IJ_06730 [Mangrovibacterium sp.]
MKKLVSLIIGVVAFVATSQAQVELTPFVGYTFSDKFYAGRIGEGTSYGVSVAYPVFRFASLDFTYMGQNGEAKVFEKGANDRFDLNSSYYLLGLTKNLPISPKFQVFTGAGLGLAVYDPNVIEYDSMIQFGVGFKAGLKFWFSNRVGLFVQGNANFPVTDVNADVWWTLGGGADGGLSTNVPFTQFGFSGGLAFKIGQISSGVEK